jgi:multicomponent K+:H+ antiporter subunit G
VSAVLEVIACALLLGGAAFSLVGSWGLAKLSDFFLRLHGPTKASTLGVGGVLLASMLWQAVQGAPSLRELLITLFLFMTAPVSAYLMANAALALDPRSRPEVPPPPQAPAE